MGEPPAKKAAPNRQLNIDGELDGNYWSVSSGGRTRKPTYAPSDNVTLTKKSNVTPTKKPKPATSIQKSKSQSLPSSPSSFPSPLPETKPTLPAVPPTTDLSATHPPSQPSHDIPSTTLSSNTSSSTSFSIPPAIPSAFPETHAVQSSTISPLAPESKTTQHPSIPPPPPLPLHLNKVKAEEVKSEKKSNIELDGSYWATFDSGIKRKKDRVLSDLTTVDADYWNKRNARVQTTNKKPMQPISEEMIAKRAEKLARSREEHRMREDETHERILRKQEDARFGKEVFQGVFLGSKHAAKNWEFFEKHQIRGVVNVTSEVPNYHEKTGSVTYVKIPVSDLPTVELLETFEKLGSTIFELTQKGNVLIHCKEGKSRSPSICMAFAMKYLNMQLAAAHESIVKKSEIRVNLGFQQQLMSYERRVFNTENNTFNFLQKRNTLTDSK